MARLTIHHENFDFTIGDLDDAMLGNLVDRFDTHFRERGGCWLNAKIGTSDAPDDLEPQVRWIPAQTTTLVAHFDNQAPADVLELTLFGI